MIVASLFGTPAGLEVQNISIGKVSQLTIQKTWVDMSLDNVELRSNSDIFRIYRRRESGKLLTWVGVYRSATEIGPSRSGGFYGAGVWLIDSIISPSAIYQVVTKLADQIRDLAIKDGKFVKKIADIMEVIVPPPEVSTLLSGRTQVTQSGLDPEEGIEAFITDHKNIISVIEWAQKGLSANFYRHVLIGQTDQFISQNSSYIKGFERLDSIYAAADLAYAQRDQELISQSKSLADLRKASAERENQQKIAQSKLYEAQRQEVSGIEEKHKIAQSQLIDRLKKDYIDQLTKKDGRIAKLEQEIKGLRANVSVLKSQKPLLEASVPSTSNYKPGSEWGSNKQKGAKLDELYDSDEPSGIRWRKVLIIGILIVVLVCVLFLSFSRSTCWNVFWCKSASEKSSNHTTHQSKPSVNGGRSQENSIQPIIGLDSKAQPNLDESSGNRTSSNSLMSSGVPVDRKNSEVELVRALTGQVESTCPTNLGLMNYKITFHEPNLSKATINTFKRSMYETMVKTCEISNLTQSCKQQLERNKNLFLADVNQFEGEILIPQSCIGPSEYGNSYSFVLTPKTK